MFSEGGKNPRPAGSNIMTVFLVLATVVLLVALDYVFRRRLAERNVTEPRIAPTVEQPSFAAVVGGFEVRENLRYHPGHTWALRESPDLVRVGLDDFAARILGKLDAIELPKYGQWIRQGQRVCTIRRNGAKTELISPVEGIVTNVNLAVVEDPELATREPYGRGWLIGVQAPDIATSFRNLLGGTVARKWMEEASARLRTKFPTLAGAVSQDGGLAVEDVGQELPQEVRAHLAREFLLTE
jgi:glycine cleavage system H lipoate-binding protein